MTTPNTSPQTVGTGPSITEFLLARIAEDDVAPSEPDEYIEGFCDLNDGTHYSGDRIVAECAAKRAIIKVAGDVHDRITGEWGGCQRWDEDGWQHNNQGTEIVRALAAVYASHPDYRQEWAL